MSENKKIFASGIGISFDKKKHTIILIHGSGQSHIVWSLTEEYLTNQGYNVFSLDLPGHGNSEGPAIKSIPTLPNTCFLAEVTYALPGPKILLTGFIVCVPYARAAIA